MAGLSFFKVPQHRVFSYQPRYYDPEKERREQRRRELGLADDEADDIEGYSTGSLIRGGGMRMRHEAFNQKMAGQKRKSQILLIALIVGLSILTYVLMRDYLDEFYSVIFK